jgi:hypothetical protein
VVDLQIMWVEGRLVVNFFFKIEEIRLLPAWESV